MEEDDDLAWLDAQIAAEPRRPWCGTMTPSFTRFYDRYDDYKEAQLLAGWLAGKTGKPIDLHIVEGKWCFTAEAIEIADRLDDAFTNNDAELNARSQQSSEHWEINRQYYSERLRTYP